MPKVRARQDLTKKNKNNGLESLFPRLIQIEELL